MIRAENLSKRYRGKLAVDNLSFTVQTGRVTGFLGPNGSGKSTTIRLMLSLDRGGGKTVYDDKRLSEYTQPSKIVGVLLEAKAFHPTRTARNHLQVLADAGSMPSQRVDEVLDLVGMRSEAYHQPGKFSLGMSQRLGIAAAVLGAPKYLILDEPANGLDPEGIAWLRNFIKHYASLGNAVFVSSHLLSEMSQMADDVVVIGKGKLIAAATVNKLVAKDTHASVFVRSRALPALKRTLKQQSLKFKAVDGGLEIAKTNAEDVGKLAFDAGIVLLELSTRHASLEDAFLELTEDAQEFRAPASREQKGGKR